MDPQELTIVSLTHDLQNKRSLALITWDGIPDRRLSVPVPFNTKIDELLPLPKQHYANYKQSWRALA